MSSRRSIAQQERRRRENEQRLRASEAMRPQQYRHVQPSPRTGTPVAPTTVFESHSGIRYNVTNMPQGAYSLATRALSSHRYLADLAMRHEDEHGSYIAFQLKKLESVRIYDYASIQQPSSLSCTCEDFVSHQVCSHIYVSPLILRLLPPRSLAVKGIVSTSLTIPFFRELRDGFEGIEFLTFYSGSMMA